MTAMAMIVGMVPMAIGGAGEEQNAALARAVIGDSSSQLHGHYAAARPLPFRYFAQRQ